MSRHNVALTSASLLAILLVTFHISEDIVRGFEPGGFKNVRGMFTMAVWLYGTLALAERRSGYVVTLLGSLLGFVVSLAHLRGAGLVGGRIANSSGQLFWVWTVFALGVTSLLAIVLSAQGLWTLRRGRSTP